MKCKDCKSCRKGFFKYKPEEYVCIGVKEPFIIDNINKNCSEYDDEYWNKHKSNIKIEENIKNIDKIRSLTIDELAKQFVTSFMYPSGYRTDTIFISIHTGYFDIEEKAIESEIKWLKSNYKES